MDGGGWLTPSGKLGAVTNGIWSFSPLLLLFDTHFAGEHLGKKALLMASAVLRAVAVLWFTVQHGSFPPEALLCCILPGSFKCVDMENLSSLNPVCAGEGSWGGSDGSRSCTKQLCRVFVPMATSGKFRERPGEQDRKIETQILDIHSQPMDLFSMDLF